MQDPVIRSPGRNDDLRLDHRRVGRQGFDGAGGRTKVADGDGCSGIQCICQCIHPPSFIHIDMPVLPEIPIVEGRHGVTGPVVRIADAPIAGIADKDPLPLDGNLAVAIAFPAAGAQGGQYHNRKDILLHKTSDKTPLKTVACPQNTRSIPLKHLFSLKLTMWGKSRSAICMVDRIFEHTLTIEQIPSTKYDAYAN